jgi:hypothetical protein
MITSHNKALLQDKFSLRIKFAAECSVNGSKGHEVRIRCTDFNGSFQIAVVNICPCNWCFRHEAVVDNVINE